jgi:hypothetical protein
VHTYNSQEGDILIGTIHLLKERFMVTQQKMLELAKQGNPKAIAALMNRSLQAKGITTKATLTGDCLNLWLESSQVPNQPAMVEFIRKGMTKLGVVAIKKVKVYGIITGKDFPVWTDDISLLNESQNFSENSSNAEASVVLEDLTTSIHPIAYNEDYHNQPEVERNAPEQKNNISYLNNNEYTVLDKPLIPKRKDKLGRLLIFFLWLRISFDITFLVYSVIWATSFIVFRAIETVDATRIISYLVYFLVSNIYAFWYYLELISRCIYLITIVISLIWIFRLHTQLNLIFNGYPIKPWGAIARFIIPFYSLWGIWHTFTTLAKKLKSQGDELTRWGSSLQRWLPWFYVSLITSNVLTDISEVQPQYSESSEVNPWLFLATNFMNLCLSIVWLQMVKIIINAMRKNTEIRRQDAELI